MSSLPTVFLYVEGDDLLRVPFQALLAAHRKRLWGRYSFQVVMGGSNSVATRKWRKKRELTEGQADRVLLLVDSEGPVHAVEGQPPDGCAGFLTPEDLETGDVFFMTQLMESWFLVYPDQLAKIYGAGFLAERLPRIPAVKPPSPAGKALEAIAKEKVQRGLSAATESTKHGPYLRSNAKTTIAPAMLEVMDLDSIAGVSFHARRLVERLETI